MALRKELHGMLDNMPDRTLPAIKPLLAFLADDYGNPVIQTDLTAEEISMIEEGMAAYKKDPSSFVPLDDVL